MTKRALVCAPVLPEFDRESGSKRIFDIVMFLRRAGWSVSYVTSQSPRDERYVNLLRQKGIATYTALSEPPEELILYGQFDVAILAFWHFAESYIPVVRALSPSTRIIVDTIDLHFLRNARCAFHEHRANGGSGLLDERYASEFVRELNVYGVADAVLTVSEKEATYIADLTGGFTPAYALPDMEDLPASAIPIHQREGILFLGNFRHPPNVDAVEYLLHGVRPRLLPSLLSRHPLTIVGNGLDDRIRSQATGLDDVRLVGWVPSVVPYLEQARVMVIPLRYGAGTKRKLIQALMVGLPTVTSTVGAEGLQLRAGEHVLVADDADTFADAVEQLLRDDGLCEQMASAGRRQICSTHATEVVHAQAAAILSSVLERKAKNTSVGGEQFAVATRRRQYQQMISRIREAVQTMTPERASIAVISKGDDELLRLDGRNGCHFPKTENGTYAGYHPASSKEAIEHLELLRTQGIDYLLVPRTSSWWFEHYPELRHHLDNCYLRIWADESGTAYCLSKT